MNRTDLYALEAERRRIAAVEAAVTRDLLAPLPPDHSDTCSGRVDYDGCAASTDCSCRCHQMVG